MARIRRGSSLVAMARLSFILGEMQLLIIRHAEAVDLQDAGGADAARVLTPAGRAQARALGRLLTRLLPTLDVLAASPLARAQETAALVGEAFPAASPLTLPALVPGAPPTAVLDWLIAQPEAANLAIVGHEPDVTRLANVLLGGRDAPLAALEKGGACWLDFVSPPRPGRGWLRALLPPAVTSG